MCPVSGFGFLKSRSRTAQAARYRISKYQKFSPRACKALVRDSCLKISNFLCKLFYSNLLDFLQHCRRFSFHERDFRPSLLCLRKSSLLVSSLLLFPNPIFPSILSVGSLLLHYTLQGESSPASTATSAASWGSFNAASTF